MSGYLCNAHEKPQNINKTATAIYVQTRCKICLKFWGLRQTFLIMWPVNNDIHTLLMTVYEGPIILLIICKSQFYVV